MPQFVSASSVLGSLHTCSPAFDTPTELPIYHTTPRSVYVIRGLKVPMTGCQANQNLAQSILEQEPNDASIRVGK